MNQDITNETITAPPKRQDVAALRSLLTTKGPTFGRVVSHAIGEADKAAAPAWFQTAQGSTYQIHEDGTTTRNKSSHEHVGHDKADQGLKDRTERTWYVANDMAASLSAAGMIGPDDKPVPSRLLFRDGKASLATWNYQENRWGIAASGKDVTVHDKPAIGLQPLEAWSKTDEFEGYEAYRSMHAGNKIVSMASSQSKLAMPPSMDRGSMLHRASKATGGPIAKAPEGNGAIAAALGQLSLPNSGQAEATEPHAEPQKRFASAPSSALASAFGAANGGEPTARRRKGEGRPISTDPKATMIANVSQRRDELFGKSLEWTASGAVRDFHWNDPSGFQIHRDTSDWVLSHNSAPNLEQPQLAELFRGESLEAAKAHAEKVIAEKHKEIAAKYPEPPKPSGGLLARAPSSISLIPGEIDSEGQPIARSGKTDLSILAGDAPGASQAAAASGPMASGSNPPMAGVANNANAAAGGTAASTEAPKARHGRIRRSPAGRGGFLHNLAGAGLDAAIGKMGLPGNIGGVLGGALKGELLGDPYAGRHRRGGNGIGGMLASVLGGGGGDLAGLLGVGGGGGQQGEGSGNQEMLQAIRKLTDVIERLEKTLNKKESAVGPQPDGGFVPSLGKNTASTAQAAATMPGGHAGPPNNAAIQQDQAATMMRILTMLG